MEDVKSFTTLLFDESKDRRLAEIYAPVFTLILNLRGSMEFGDAEPLRDRIRKLLKQSKQEALQSGVPSEDIRLAEFALVAFMDETILSSDWTQKDRWVAKPLQLELYERYDAGEAFFDRLEQLREQSAVQAEVLEVYYLCMALGFKGKYQLHEQEKLRTLVEDTFDDLRQLPGLQQGALSPHGKPRDQVVNEMRSKVPPWMIAAGAGLVALLIYIGMSVHITNTADEAVHMIREIAAATGVVPPN
jgi:type VI secretion system protein ImpK